MAIGNVNYATNYGRALEQAYPYVLYFGDLYSTPNNGRFRWVNAKTIEIPSIHTTGRIDADRDSIGEAARNYDNAWQTKTLTNQRKWSTLVHPMDIDQTNLAASIANITKTFNDEHKFPEMDAYTASTLFSAWTTSIAATTGHDAYVGRTPSKVVINSENVLEVFDDLMLKMTNARVPLAGRILYVTNEVKTILKNAAKLTRMWDVQTSADGLNRDVEYLDNVKIIPVPKELMKTKYDFTNDWAVDATAAQIDMLLVNPASVITPVSYTFSKLDAPSAVTEGKYYYYEESFEDVFILNNKADGLQFNVDYTCGGLTVVSAAGSSSGKTALTVTPAKGTSNYYFTITAADVTLPEIGAEIKTTDGYASWDGSANITATTGNKIAVIECVKVSDKYYAIKAGKATVVSAA